MNDVLFYLIAILIFMIGIAILSPKRFYIKNGHIRYVKKLDSKFYLFKENIGFGRKYECCFVYKDNQKDTYGNVKLVLNRKWYLLISDSASTNRIVRLSYEKNLFGFYKICNVEV